MSESTADTDRDREAHATTDRGGMKWVSAIAALIGLWIAASPFVYETTEMALWNNVAVGLAVFVVAGYNYFRMSNARPANAGAAGLVVLLGLWTLVAPFMLEFASEALLWSNVASGAIVVALAGYNAYASRETRADAATRTRA